MLTKLTTALSKISSLRVLVVLIALYLVFVLYLFPNSAYESAAGPLDLKFTYTPDTAYKTLEAFGEEGRAQYARGAMTIDLAYPVVYTLMFAVWLTLVLKNAPQKFNPKGTVPLLPLTVFIFDLTENAGVIALIKTYPDRHDAVAWATSFATTSKWLCAGFVISLTGLFTLHSAWRRLSNR
jgi:hypothetical protein